MRGRPIKKGLDYYPLNVDFLQDIKVRKIMRGCGVPSIAILVSLLSSIYRDEGYYVGWDSDMTFLVADEVGASEGAVLEVVNKAIQVDFFNEEVFRKYKILTSRGIQKRFLEAATRRVNIDLVKEYLLVDILNDYSKLLNVNIKSINDNRNEQRKEKESKEKESKEKESKEKKSGEENENPSSKTPPKPSKTQKHKYGEYNNVLLTDLELEKLKNEFPSNYQYWIEKVSEYCAISGKTYKNYLATIRNWSRKGVKSKSNKVGGSTNPFVEMMGEG